MGCSIPLRPLLIEDDANDASLIERELRRSGYAVTPERVQTAAELEVALQGRRDVTAELVSFDYIGHDDEFGVARAKVKTTGKGSGDFTNNTVDAIFLFHQENGTWKLWSEQILAVQMP